LHEPGIALRNRNGKPRADDGALAGLELDALARRQVEARVAVIGTRREDRVVPESLDRERDQATR
jgi:hypothetical protein